VLADADHQLFAVGIGAPHGVQDDDRHYAGRVARQVVGWVDAKSWSQAAPRRTAEGFPGIRSELLTDWTLHPSAIPKTADSASTRRAQPLVGESCCSFAAFVLAASLAALETR